MLKKINVFGILCSMAALLLIAQPAQSQNLDDVKLFQSYFFDAPISKVPYGEGGFQYDNYDAFSRTFIGVQGGYPYSPKIELGAELDYINVSIKDYDGQSGLSDLGLYGRYNLKKDNKTNISAGGLFTLPIGSEDVWEGQFDFGGFGAMRHLLENGMVVTGTAALIFYESGDERDSLLRLGGGVIYSMNRKTALVGELVIQTEGNYMMLSGGANYKLGNGTLRGALGLGLDDGAPDLSITAKYAITL